MEMANTTKTEVAPEEAVGLGYGTVAIEGLEVMAGNDLGAILKRIDRRLEAVQLTDRAASIAAGMSADGIRTMRRQWAKKMQKTATTHTLSLLARPLQTTTEWLMNEIGPEDVRDARARRDGVRRAKNSHRAKNNHRVTGLHGATQFAPIGLKVSGEVAAGTWREAVSNESGTPDTDIEVPAHPGYPPHHQFVVMVRGTSISRVAQYGDFLIVLDVEKSGISVRHNDLVLVSRTKAGLVEMTAKRYCVAADEKSVELRYDSLDPQFNCGVLATLPLRAGGPGSKADDGTEIALKGIVLGVWRAPS